MRLHNDKTLASNNLYAKFVKNLEPYATAQGVSVDTLVNRLEWRTTFDSDDDPDFFPCSCICGEELTATAHQFDDPWSAYQSTYLIGSVCATNLQRELQRRKVLKQLRKFLDRKSKGEPWGLKLEQTVLDCRLFAANVFTPAFNDEIDGVIDRCSSMADRHEVLSEAACVAYGQMEGLIPIHFGW